MCCVATEPATASWRHRWDLGDRWMPKVGVALKRAQQVLMPVPVLPEHPMHPMLNSRLWLSEVIHFQSLENGPICGVRADFLFLSILVAIVIGNRDTVEFICPKFFPKWSMSPNTRSSSSIAFLLEIRTYLFLSLTSINVNYYAKKLELLRQKENGFCSYGAFIYFGGK